MDGWELLLELVAALSAAFLLGAIFERLRFGAVVGYILGGVLVGPSALGVVKGMSTVQGLAELGIALMLFTTGLEFSILRLRKLGRSTLLAGISQLLVCLIVGTGVGTIFGLGVRSAIAVAAVVAVSSTAIVLRVLRERGDLDASHGKISFGILLIQDIALVPLVLLVTLLGTGKSPAAVPDLLKSGAVFLVAAVVFLLLITRVLPRLFRSKAMATNRELPILLGVITCTGSALAAHSLGLSPSLGAFLAGVLLAETSFEEQIRSDMGGLKALFGTLFFASVGMLLDTDWLFGHIPLVVGITALVIFGKMAANFAAIRLWKRTTISSAGAAIVLAQVGELGFILIQIGTAGKLFPGDISQLLTSAAVLSMIVSPKMVAKAPKLARALAKRLVPVQRLAKEEVEERQSSLSKHFIVIGFGTAGKTVARILGEAQYTVLGIDVDPKFAKQAEEIGAIPRVGDATQVDLLSEVHLNDARALIVAIPDHRTSSLVIGHARRLAPALPIVVRARYHQFQDDLREAGATLVIGEEELLGRRLGEEAVHLGVGTADEDVREAT